jgi:hypothetical protein
MRVDILTKIEKWQPVSYGALVNTILFTSKKTWLIIRTTKNELDLTLYTDEVLGSELFRKVTSQGRKFAHHLRISHEDARTPIHFELL